jgi:hypothetical protein
MACQPTDRRNVTLECSRPRLNDYRAPFDTRRHLITRHSLTKHLVRSAWLRRKYGVCGAATRLLLTSHARFEDLEIAARHARTFCGACHVSTVFFEHTLDITALEFSYYFLTCFTER